MKVHAGELGVVVEHLLEVRDEPAGIRRVAMEAAAELVVDAAGRHGVERPAGHVELDRRGRVRSVPAGDPAEEEFERHRRWELRSPAPATVDPVEGPGEGRHRLLERRRGQPGARVALRIIARPAGCLDERLDESRPGSLELRPPLAPRLGDPRQHLAEARQPVPGRRREVRPAVERRSVRGEEYAHRPATAAGHRLDGGHVDLVEVGAFLAIDLDGDEVAAQIGGGRRILE